ncbi:endodeoxyribonuclease [Tulasnella sp. 408]|nr:endodeoxyribonuclease [Tulasnella sp. 408]
MASNLSLAYVKSEEEDDISVFLQDNLDGQANGSLIEDILAEEAEAEETNKRRSYAISCLENLIHSFLNQLVEAIEDEDTQGRPRGHIKLQLADRKAKSQYDGRTDYHRFLRQPDTSRDIYYKDPGLFGKQSVVDKLVDDLAATFDLDRSDLRVRASSKGLFAGSGLTIRLRHGGTATGNDYDGKGYPDVATRELVNTFSNELPEDVPILAVIDADPHGIEILSVFKYGSLAMDHQRDKLAAPRIQWIGVFASELQSLGIPPPETIPLTKIDHKKVFYQEFSENIG